MQTRKRLLVVGSGAAEAYRLYSLESIARAFDVVLLDDAPPTWQSPHVVDAVVTPFDEALDALDPLLAEQPVDGVMTWDERRLDLVARIAARHGLRGPAPEVVEACRDKWRTRSVLAAAGVPSARSILTRTVDEAIDAAREIGYPVVVKPRSLAGSIGVQRVDHPDGMRSAWELADGAVMATVVARPGVLVEEYLTGDEFSLECVTADGATDVVAITRKQVGSPPYFEELGHVVDAADRASGWADEAADVARCALDALGVRVGVSHVEVRIDGTGPRIIEVNARLGGDLIPHLVHLATGVDLSLAAACVATGVEVPRAPVISRAAGIHFFTPPEAGTFVEHRVGSWADEPWVERCVWVRAHGDRMGLPPDVFMARLGFAVLTGDDAETVRERARLVASGTRITMGSAAVAR
jgi:carbamoylphosphate synthase large subunit